LDSSCESPQASVSPSPLKAQRPLWDFPFEDQASWWESHIGGPSFRFKQARQWIYQHRVLDPQLMNNLPADLRLSLAEKSPGVLQFDTCLKANDGSADKYLFKCKDGARLESVMLRSGPRRTICLSTQVGCALGCKFCHTGLAGFKRNLSVAEMVEQVLRISAHEEQRISNMVIMGMGEPMQNYNNLMTALRQINHPDGLNLGARHITISTSGVRGGVLRLAEEPEQWGLAVSLHAPTDELRSELMPINRSVPIAELMSEIHTYIAKTNRRVSFEYIMLGDTNSGEKEARELLQLIKGMLCHVNLIPYNPVPTLPYSATPLKAIQQFSDILQKGGVPCTVRMEKGQDILAACGQLAHREVNKNKDA
jgi:23S rRNA (adenine2503-C2)-methyltransferase